MCKITKENDSLQRQTENKDENSQKIKLHELVNIPQNKILISEISPKKYISTENMISNFGGITQDKHIPKARKINKFLKNDILISNIRPYLKKIWLAEFDGGCSTDIIILRPKDSKMILYLFYALSTDNFFNYMMKTSKGTKMPRGDKKAVLQYTITLNKIFQELYTNLLVELDKKIELMEKKHTLYQNIKKYLLKNLFAHKSEYPILRFNFNDKLKKITLKDILKESKIKTNDDINKRLTVKLNLNGITKRIPNTSEVEGATTQYLRKSGQFIYGKQNLHNGAFGIIPSYLDGYLSSSDIPSFDFIKSIDKFWLYYYFSDKDYYHRLERLSTGTGSKRISPTDFLKIKINMPSFNEQEKIVDLISSLDIKINEIQKQIKNTKKFKKGLLQKMFC